MKEKKKLSLAAQIFIALVLAIIAGLLMQNYADFANSYIKPFGTIFLNLVKFIVVPIVLFSILLFTPRLLSFLCLCPLYLSPYFDVLRYNLRLR